jgi:hypothetical protein
MDMPDNGMTELDLLVGSMFTTLPDEDREHYEAERAWLLDVQRLLAEEGVEVDLLANPGVEIWEGGIERYHDLFLLRLIAVYLEQGQDIQPCWRPISSSMKNQTHCWQPSGRTSNQHVFRT